MTLLLAAVGAVVTALIELTVTPYLLIGTARPHPVLVLGVIGGVADGSGIRAGILTLVPVFLFGCFLLAAGTKTSKNNVIRYNVSQNDSRRNGKGGIQIWADSAGAYTTSNLAHLIGSVRYEDPRRSLRAEEARYFSEVEAVMKSLDGRPHWGNYFGAIRQYIELQDTASEAFYFIANLHALTSRIGGHRRIFLFKCTFFEPSKWILIYLASIQCTNPNDE